MNRDIARVAYAMMECNKGDRRRIEHTLKVFAYATQLGLESCLDMESLERLQVTALLHDIGIHVAELKFGSCSSQQQEVEGPPVAKQILGSLHFPLPLIERVCYIISKHHTFSAIDGIDFQLLVEADFLVNASEEAMSDHQIIHFAQRIFKSESGRAMLGKLFPHLEKSIVRV